MVGIYLNRDIIARHAEAHSHALVLSRQMEEKHLNVGLNSAIIPGQADIQPQKIVWQSFEGVETIELVPIALPVAFWSFISSCRFQLVVLRCAHPSCAALPPAMPLQPLKPPTQPPTQPPQEQQRPRRLPARSRPRPLKVSLASTLLLHLQLAKQPKPLQAHSAA